MPDNKIVPLDIDIFNLQIWLLQAGMDLMRYYLKTGNNITIDAPVGRDPWFNRIYE